MKLTGIIENVFNGRLIFRGYATLVDLVEFRSQTITINEKQILPGSSKLQLL